MRSYSVAVVGATGAVGREMVKILAERNFPLKKLRLLATARSAGQEISFKDEKVKIEVIKPRIFADIDIALFSIGSTPSKEIAPRAVKEGAIVIDNSNAFRMDDHVPLVVPEVNREDIAEHQGIIANPNCSTIQMVVAIKPIYDEVGIKRIIVSTYQAVSGTGKKAIKELQQQVEHYYTGQEMEAVIYPHQIAFNVLPHIDVFTKNGYTREEIKMFNETRKIMHDQELLVNATCARVPVFCGQSEAVTLETASEISLERVRELLHQAAGVKVVDDPVNLIYPLALLSEKDDDVLVGRLRKDLTHRLGINLWIVGNNLRKGAALNAVQIAEEVITNQLV